MSTNVHFSLFFFLSLILIECRILVLRRNPNIPIVKEWNEVPSCNLMKFSRLNVQSFDIKMPLMESICSKQEKFPYCFNQTSQKDFQSKNIDEKLLKIKGINQS